MQVSVIRLSLADHQSSTSYVANLEGIQDIEIRPQVGGYLKHIAFAEGQKVEKGDLLFRIEAAPFEAQLQNANANYSKEEARFEKAKIELQRIKKLQEANIISETRLDNAKADYNAALASLKEAGFKKDEARILRDFTSIYAPFDGYTGKIQHKVGSLVDNDINVPLVSMSKVDTIYTYFSMSEKDFAQFKDNYPGSSIEEKINNIPPVDLRLVEGKLYENKGKVNMVNGFFDRSTGSIILRASFPNPNGLLRSGNTGTVILYRESENSVSIPKSATFEVQDKILVYKITPDHYLRQTPVKVKELDSKNYVLLEGLEPDDVIVEKGLERLKDSLQIIPNFKDQ